MSENQQQVTTETITAGSYITTLLHRIVTERRLIRVRPSTETQQSPSDVSDERLASVGLSADGQQTLTSTVLQVLPNERQLLLDDLFPQLPAKTTPSSLDIEARLEGEATLRFTASVASPQQEGGMRQWRLAFPKSIEYSHMRQEHRVDVSALAVPVRILLGEGVVMRGQLQDLSAHGMCLRLASAKGLKRGNGYRCRIDPSEGESMVVTIEPYSAEKVEGALPVRLGTHLQEMDRQERQQWQRFVVEMERQRLRHE